MSYTENRYLNPCTDFGFKKIFKDEANVDLLKDFLNQVLASYHEELTEINPIDGEDLGATPKERASIFDLRCKNQNGSTIVVEVQNNPQKYFADRVLYYLSRLIVGQGERGEWDFQIAKVYIVSIVNAPGVGIPEREGYKSEVLLIDRQTGSLWSDKVGLVFLDLTKFQKEGNQLESRYDKWLYYIKHLQEIDAEWKEEDGTFQKLLAVSAIDNLTEEERKMYKTEQELQWERYKKTEPTHRLRMEGENKRTSCKRTTRGTTAREPAARGRQEDKQQEDNKTT